METPLPDLQRFRPFYLVALGGVLLWASFPPLGIWPLSFVAIVLWLVVIANPLAFCRPRAFRSVWLVSFLFWLAMNYFVTLPHWAGYFGWVAMSAYLSIYIPFFFASAQALTHRFRVSLIVAAPLSWVAMEWLRAHIITGYGMGMLPHTMYRVPLLIQTADLIGGYGTSFLMVLASAALLQCLKTQGTQRVMAMAILLATAGSAAVYGYIRLSEKIVADKTVSVALIQGSRDVRFEKSAEAAQKERLAQFREYRDLTLKARQRWPELDLIVWPEGAFPELDQIPQPDESSLAAETRGEIADRRNSAKYCYLIGMGVERMHGDSPNQPILDTTIPLLAGGHAFDPVRNDEYNSAFLFDRDGNVIFRYQKMHLVMFGEYVPLGEWLPIVYRLTPIPGALAAGTTPDSFDMEGLRFSPSICFESTVGHLIRRQVVELAEKGRAPDVLVNVTNDGWFFGSNCLDLHLACNVFRAVELRKPMLVAANTGFSAHIDGCGRIIDQGPRRATDILRAEVIADGRTSAYLRVGDGPAIVMTAVAVLAWILTWLERKLRLPPRGA